MEIMLDIVLKIFAAFGMLCFLMIWIGSARYPFNSNTDLNENWNDDEFYDEDFEPSTYEECLIEFHDKFDQPIELTPRIPVNAELRARLIEEEAKETADALRRGDLVEAVDGMCDLLYVTFGCALESGVSLYDYFEEVHRTNMNKVGGGVREDGKILKPKNWVKPKIKEMLIDDGAHIYD